MLREMQQSAGGAKATSHEADIAGNTRSFAKPAKEQEHGMFRFAFTVYLARNKLSRTEIFNQPPMIASKLKSW